MPDGNFSCTGTLGDGLGLLRVAKWWSNGLTAGEVLAGWDDWGIRMHLGQHLAGLGRCFLGWHTRCRWGVGFGM